MDDATIKIEQLRKWRATRRKDVSIDVAMNHFRHSLKKTNKQLLQIQTAWEELTPKRLHSAAFPISLRQGVLYVSVDGSPTAYQVNRLVRSGLLRQLQKSCSGTLRQIKVTVGS